MCSLRKYDDILADILNKRVSRCVCPEEYLAAPPLMSSKPTTLCQFGPNCQFEMGQTKTCAFKADVCTCVRCTCGVNGPPPPPSASLPGCICPGPCRCEPEEQSPPKCEKSVCVCSYCACEPEVSSPNLLPSSFRTVLKREGRRMMTDQEMREERQSIKRLIDEVSAVPKDADVEDKKALKRKKSKSDKLDEDLGRKEEQKQIEDSPKQSLKSAKAPKVSIVVPLESTPENKISVKKRSATLPKETPTRKSNKKTKLQKGVTTLKSSKTVVQYQSRVGTAEKKKPIRIRYYYAGGFESYGVKVGHVNCLERPVSVPKNMGWLWNIEDPSKGIRERKGWPPGFIGKNIKNMIQVMKMFASVDTTNQKGDTRELRRWKTQPDTRAEKNEPRDEPPLLHIHKKGRTYDITFCPKDSDDDIGPVPIPFTITQKRRDGDSDTDDSSSLEFEFHSPKPKARWSLPRVDRAPSIATEEAQPQPQSPPPPPSEPKPPSGKGKKKKKKSLGSEENRNNWEDHPTQIEKVPSSTVAGP